MDFSKKFTFLVLFLIVQVTCLAQEFSMGLLTGFHGYTVSFEDRDDRDIFNPKLKYGYRLGTYITFPLPNSFAWSTELSYAKKGRKIEIESENMVNDADYNFLEISVLLRKSYSAVVFEGLQGKYFFNIGPNVNYWMNGSGVIDAAVDLPYDVKFQSIEGDGDFENNYIVDGNRWLFGLELGAGIEAPLLKNQYVQIEFRFTLGQTFLGAKDGSIPVNSFQTQDNLRSNYRVFNILLRYGVDFDLKDSKKGKSTKRVKRRKRR